MTGVEFEMKVPKKGENVDHTRAAAGCWRSDLLFDEDYDFSGI